MALKVPTYESREGIKNAGYAGPVARQRSADEFLSINDKMLAPALRNLSQGLGQLGQAIHADDVRKRQEAMELELLDDIQGFQASSSKYYDDYTQNYQGKNAAFAEQDGLKFYEQELGQLRHKWQGNQQALLHFGRKKPGPDLQTGRTGHKAENRP